MGVDSPASAASAPAASQPASFPTRDLFAQAVFYHQNKDFPRAIELLKRVIRANPRNSNAYKVLLTAYVNSEQFEKAIQVGRSATLKFPKDGDIHFAYTVAQTKAYPFEKSTRQLLERFLSSRIIDFDQKQKAKLHLFLANSYYYDINSVGLNPVAFRKNCETVAFHLNAAISLDPTLREECAPILNEIDDQITRLNEILKKQAKPEQQ